MSRRDDEDDSIVLAVDGRTGEVRIVESGDYDPYVPSREGTRRESAEDVTARHRRWDIRYLEQKARECRDRVAGAEAEIASLEKRFGQLDPIPELNPYRYELLQQIKARRHNAEHHGKSANLIDRVVDRLRNDPGFQVRIRHN